MKFSIAFKYSNITFKNKETKETIAYDTKASEGSTFTFDNVDEDVVIGMLKGIKDKKASQVFAFDNLRTNFINTLARNKCKELYDKLDKAEWKIEDIAISNITIKDVEFTKPTMNAREAITVESKKIVKESADKFKPGDIVDWFVPEDDEQYGKEFGGEVFRGGEVYKKQGDVYEVSFGEEGLFYPQGKDLEYHSESLVESISKKNYPKGGYPTYVVKERLVDLIEGCPRQNPMWADLVEILEKYYGEAALGQVMESGNRKPQPNYVGESIDGEYDDEDVGDGQWHVFDYGHGFPYTEQYMIMAPTGDTWPATSSGAICDYDGEYSYSTRMEMEDDVFAVEVDGEEWTPTELEQPYPRPVQKAIRLVISRLEEEGITVDEP